MTSNNNAPVFDRSDVLLVKVNFELLIDDDEKRIEQNMKKAINDNDLLDKLNVNTIKLNLKSTFSANKQVRTYFIDQYSTTSVLTLYRYDKNLQLKTVGMRKRTVLNRYQSKYDYKIFETPEEFTPAPICPTILVKPKDAVYKIAIDKDTNLLDSHPFKESQIKLTYGTLNDYTRAYQKNEKVAIRDITLKFKLHGIDSKHDGTLIRVITDDTAHYFKCAKPGLGKGGNLSVFLPTDDGSIKEVKRWMPKKHLPMLKELVVKL